MKFNYNNICSMDFYGACPDISAKRNDEIMKKCTIGNKKKFISFEKSLDTYH